MDHEEISEHDRAFAVMAQENAKGCHQTFLGFLGVEGYKNFAIRTQLRAARHYATARSIMGIEEHTA